MEEDSIIGITEKCPGCKHIVKEVTKVGDLRFCFFCGTLLETGETYVSKDFNPDNSTMTERYLGHE